MFLYKLENLDIDGNLVLGSYIEKKLTLWFLQKVLWRLENKIDKICVEFGGQVFMQSIWITIGTNCAPHLIYPDEFEELSKQLIHRWYRMFEIETNELQNQGIRLDCVSSLQKFNILHRNLIDRYKVSFSQIRQEIFRQDYRFWHTLAAVV